MKTKLLIILFLGLGLVTACAEMDPHPMNMDLAVQDAKTREDHEELAEHYEEAAQDMREKAREHAALLDHYQSKSFKYGRQAQDFKAHCQRLVDAYEKAAEENMEMARMHRQME
jgi:hypothetical protein